MVLQLLPILRKSIKVSYRAATHYPRRGNNVISFKSSQTATTQESGDGLVFDFPPDFTAAPTTTGNVNSARVNTFYIVNTVHDISYKYGFTEAAFK